MQDLALEAVSIQNTCNVLGLSKGYATALQDLEDQLRGWDHWSLSTKEISNHPINRLWVSKLHDLAGMGLSDTERYGEAYRWCQDVARIEEAK
jgi:hypothetical protein